MSKSQRGDTLIEVMVAFAVMAVAIVGAMSLMNRGVSSMYDSMEVSMVKNLMDRQAESLYYARDQYLAELSGSTLSSSDKAAANLWRNSLGNNSGLQDWGGAGASVPPMDGCDMSNSFFIIRTSGSTPSIRLGNGIATAATGLPEPGKGLWIQRKSSAAGTAMPYRDFYIKACWQPTGGGVEQKLSTIVRLYEK